MTIEERLKALASRSVGERFASLRKNAVLRKFTGFDYATQEATQSVQTVKMIRKSFTQSQLDGRNVLVGDYLLLGECQHLVWDPEPDKTEVDFDGQRLIAVNWGKDAADASFWIQVRLK